MSEHEQRDCGSDVAAYALGALDEAEAAAFRHHLESCSVCQEELASFRQVVGELPLAAPSHSAPPALRRRIMREVTADARRRQQQSGAARPRRGMAAPTWLTPRPALALAVVMLVIVGAVVSLTSSSSPTARVVAARVVGGGSAQLRILRGRGSLVVRHVLPPPAGKIYEVWLARGAAAPTPTSALFGVTSAGNADVEVPGNLRGVSTVMVTPEPAGGSPHPTHSPIITVSLT